MAAALAEEDDMVEVDVSVSETDSDENAAALDAAPPLPNTLETTLALFPLAETRLFRTSVKRGHREMDVCPPSVAPQPSPPSEYVLKNVLFPSDDDLLGDSFDRVDIDSSLKKRRGGDEKKRNVQVMVRRVTDLLASSGAVHRAVKMDDRFKTALLGGEEKKRPARVRVQRTAGGKKQPASLAEVAALAEKQRQREEKKQPKPILTDVTALLAAPAAKTYSFMMPNEFNVRMVTPYELFDYQLKTVRWLIEREDGRVRIPYQDPAINGCLLAMKMGLGKTPTAATLIARTLMQQRAERSCTIYICPKNLLGTVRNEFEKFFGDQMRITIFHRDFLRSAYEQFSETEIRQYDVIITNYTSVTSLMSRANKTTKKGGAASKKPVKAPKEPSKAVLSFSNFEWFRIILDESHEIREKNTVRFRGMMAMKSKRRLCLTGTPIHNSIKDLYTQLEFCGLRLPRGTKQTKENLRSMKISSMVSFVEYKDASSVKLPPKTVHKIYFTLSAEEKVLHEFYMKSARNVFKQSQEESGRMKARHTLEAHHGMVRVMQVCSAPYIITPAAKLECPDTEDMAEAQPAAVFPSDMEIDKWIKIRDGAAGLRSSKMRAFVETMTRLRADCLRSATAATPAAFKVLVFANMSSTLRIAISAMCLSDAEFEQKCVFVHGGITAPHKREELLTRFRKDPRVEVLFMTLKVGSIGLNLTEADKVVFLEPWYAYSALSQGESRIHRIGQLKPVDVYYFMARDSAEERVYRTAQTKKELADDVADQQRDTKLQPNDMRYILFDKMDAADTE